MTLSNLLSSLKEQILGKGGIQVTIDEFLIGDVYEQALANKKAKEEYRHQLGKVKSKLLVKSKTSRNERQRT